MDRNYSAISHSVPLYIIPTSPLYPDTRIHPGMTSGGTGEEGERGGGGGGGGGGSDPTMDYLSSVVSSTDKALMASSQSPIQTGTQSYFDPWDWANSTFQQGNLSLGGGRQWTAGGEQETAFNWGILLLAPLVVFGIAGNILVILAISMERRLQNVTNYFLLSLAVTDLLVSLIVMPFSIINEFTGRWLFGLILCNLFVTADVLMCTSSILHLCTISLERYIGIRYPLWAKNKSKRTVFFKIVLVWTLALAITSPITVLGMVSHSNILHDGQCLLSNNHFIIYGSIFAFFIPLTIMVVMYALTVHMLNKQAKLCGGGVGTDSEGIEGKPVIRRSTSRRHWQRHNRHTVLGAPGSGSYRREAISSASSCPLGAASGRPRYQPLVKRNTLPLYREQESSLSPTGRESSNFHFCNGEETANASEELLELAPNHKTSWRQFARKKSSQSSTEGEPRRLKELVRKHHVAVKAANILLMRKDVIRKESSAVQTEQKASKVLGVVFMIFVICWAPFFLVNILTVLCSHCYFSPTLFTGFVWLGYVSSTLNPIIYTVFNEIFKVTFLKLLCCRYGLLHRGRRRSTTPGGLGAVGRNSSGTCSSNSGLVTCNSFCRNGGSSSVIDQSIC